MPSRLVRAGPEPVFTQIETVRCPGRGNELEHRQGNTARVDLLEDEAHRFLRSLLLKHNHRQHVVAERVEDSFPKLEEARKLVAVVRHKRVLPGARVEDLIAWEVERGDLALSRRQI